MAFIFRLKDLYAVRLFSQTFLVTVATPTLRVSDVFDLHSNNNRLCYEEVSLISVKLNRLPRCCVEGKPRRERAGFLVSGNDVRVKPLSALWLSDWLRYLVCSRGEKRETSPFTFCNN